MNILLFLLNLVHPLKLPISVSVPPQRPVIYEASKRDAAKIVEAYNEGSDVLLVCEVTGGE